MKQSTINQIWTGKCTAAMPTKQDILDLKVGDMAPNAFGADSEVTRIFARDTDINGKAFVCYYVKFDTDAEMSNSMKEGELVRTVALSSFHTSAEITRIEKQLGGN